MGLKIEDVEPKDQGEKKKKITSEPSFIIELPSKGLCGYPKELEFRPFNIKELKTLSQSSGSLKLFFTKIKDIIRLCAISDFDVDDITTFDFITILLAMRINSISHIHSIFFPCENCNKNINHDVNLNDFLLNSKDLPEGFEEPHTIQGYEIRLPRVGTALLPVVENDNFEIVRTSLGLKNDEFERLSGTVFHESSKWIIENNYGVDTTVNVKCPFDECGEVMEITIPFRPDFFL